MNSLPTSGSEEGQAPAKLGPSGGSRRRMAREAALKLLYAHEIHEGMRSPAALRSDVLDYYDISYRRPAETKLDVKLFDRLCSGVLERREELDVVIKRYLNKDWRFERLELLMRDTLRLGVYELAMLRDVSVATIINEYIDITRGFFNDAEAAFVNALLDSAAGELRPDEVREARPEATEAAQSEGAVESDEEAPVLVSGSNTLTLNGERRAFSVEAAEV